MYEIYNFLTKYINEKVSSKNLVENYIKILTIIFPIVPHFVSECMDDLNIQNKLYWPKVEKEYLEENEVNYVIQINGRKED